MFETIVVGADASPTAAVAVAKAAQLAALCRAKLHIVTAYKPKSMSAPDIPSEFAYSLTRDKADALLDELAFAAKLAGADVVTHAKTNDAVDAILEVADAVAADLVVVGNKGMKGARRVLGSIPNSVSHRAPCSVLVVETSEEVT